MTKEEREALIEKIEELRLETQHGRYAEKGYADDFNDGVDAALSVVRAGVVAEEPEWEYGVIRHDGVMVNNGDYMIQQTHRRRKAGPWVPVEN